MKLTLITPFRIPLNIDKNLILSNPDEWTEHLGHMAAHLDQKRVWWATGRYGSMDSASPIYKGVQDLGSSLRSFYVLKVSRLEKESAALREWARALSPANGVELSRLKASLADICQELEAISSETIGSFDFERAACEFRLVDNNIGLLGIHLPVHTEKLTALDQTQVGLVGEFSMAAAVMALRALWGGEVREAVEWARASMVFRDGTLRGIREQTLKEKLKGKSEQSFLMKEISVFDLPKEPSESREDYWTNTENAVVAWVSRVLTLDREEAKREALDRMEAALIGLGISSADFRKFKAGEDVYGWGPKLRRESPAGDASWLEALYIAQFHYYSVDNIDRRIPLVITQVRNEHRAGASTRALKIGRNVIQEAQMALYDYMDMKLRVAGEARSIIEQVVASWDMSLMLNNIERKIVNLRDTVTQVSDDVDKRSSTAIETILFIITLLSIITLPIALHEYLKPTEEKFFMSFLYTAQQAKKDEILLLSFIIVMIGLAVFLFMKRRARR